MNPEVQSFIQRLARGEPGPATAELAAALRELGLEFRTQNDQLCLAEPLELLDVARIGDGLSAVTRQQLSQLNIFWSIDSTNTWLLGRADDSAFHGSVCLAEQQLAGKGRRGRQWVSPFGRNIYLSLGWVMSTAGVGASGLSLVVGMCVASVLRGLGVNQVGLKWPNDVLISGGKLAGILVEMAASSRNQARMVIGIGLNLRLDARDAGRIDQKFSTLADYAAISRNLLASRLIDEIVPELTRFSQQGFSAYASRWNSYNLYLGKPVSVSLVNETIHGIDRGVDTDGNLQLETPAGVISLNAGEVSLRPTS